VLVSAALVWVGVLGGCGVSSVLGLVDWCVVLMVVEIAGR